jgi:hypothetical protein
MVTRTRDRLREMDLEGSIDLRPLLGRWVNFNKQSTGICRVEIDDWEGLPTVRIIGANHPDPIDWGEVAGAAFAGAVGGRRAAAFTASYDFAFVRVLLAGHLDNHRLIVDAYSTFTDSSGRAAYVQRDNFYLP